jgi:hypothetical protein
MHVLEQYALGCGLKIDKPYIYEKYFPIPYEQYITFNASSKFNSLKYSYWQEVIDLLSPILKKENIHIVQIGGQNEKNYKNCLPLMGQTNCNQIAYIIKNSMLHFGAESFSIQVASHFKKKIVALYSNAYAAQSKPYWSDSEDVELIQANMNGNKPSYSPEENPKIIDNIMPEEIASKISKLLNLPNEIKHQTIFIGQRYGSILLEAIPSIILQNNIFEEIPLNIRFDYIDDIEEKDYICTLNNLNIRKCAIITDKPIEIEKIAQLKHQIINLFYDITFKDIDLNFVDKIKSLGMKVDFIFNKSKNKNQSILDDKKLKLIDYQEIINIVENTDKSIEEIKESKFYKSKKILFANNNSYLSKAAYLENKPINLEKLDFIQAIDEIKNIDLLIEEDADYCLFYK